MQSKTAIRLLAAYSVVAICGADGLGPFESSTDIGVTPLKGKVEFDGSSGYTVTGGGDNMWAATDAFHYVWKKVSGDVALAADVHFLGAGVVGHRKAALMIRQSLDPNSAYADVALHGDGLTSLQYRLTAAAQTLEARQEAKSDLTAPVHIRIERRGDRFTMLAGKTGGPLTSTGPATVALHDPVYIGLAVCSHDAKVLETAVFSNVSVETLPARPPQPRYSSKITIFDIRNKSARTIYQADTIWEAPNWSPDGKYLLANSGGRLYRIPVDGSGSATPEAVNIDPSLRLNNDHAPSPDGKQIAFSASSPTSRGSQVYLANADGSNVRLMVSETPSYFHGWSPDGKYLAYVHQHPGPGGAPANYDIFRIPAAGGASEQLDSNPGYDDGPDYSPDGKWIYFNSDRAGGWDVWRIPADGAGPGDRKAERVTSDDLEDWFPHPSPDRKWLLFLSFPKGTANHNDKLPGTLLRMMPMPGAHLPKTPNIQAKTPQIQVVTTFFGGQGTINVNSWSPDSKRFAYVIYEPLPPAAASLAAAQNPPRPAITGVAHIAIYAGDYEKSRAFYRDFLGLEEPYSLSKPDGTPAMTFFKINERQYIELFPETTPKTDRLNHISIQTDNAEAMRVYLASRGIAVPNQVPKGRIGNSNFNIKDPEGHTVEIVQYEPDGWTVREHGMHLPAARISSHMMHVGIIVTRFDAEMKFYQEVLGFREFWRGSSSGTELSWVNLKVPEGDDYLELMLYKDAPAPDRRGSAHHLCLEVPDAAAAMATLEARPYRKQYTRTIESKVGVNRKRQVNLYDPDGTRTELMEPVTVDGKPAPPSQAPPPR